jgi:membrane glycosyltransferase
MSLRASVAMIGARFYTFDRTVQISRIAYMNNVPQSKGMRIWRKFMVFMTLALGILAVVLMFALIRLAGIGFIVHELAGIAPVILAVVIFFWVSRPTPKRSAEGNNHH